MDHEFTTLRQLLDIANADFCKNNKIKAIKIIRKITGETLRDTKDFVEQRWIPLLMVTQRESPDPIVGTEYGEPADDPIKPEDLLPPMFLVGHTYRRLNKSVVLILGVANPNTLSETVYTIDSKGNVIHHYNRRDFGRVTGTSYTDPDPRNLEIVR